MKRRSIFAMITIFIVSIGLYRIYWLLMTRQEMISKKLSIKSPLFLLAPILLMTVAVAAIYNTAERTPRSSLFANPADWAIVLFYVACALFLPMLAYFYWSYSKAVSQITKDSVTFPVAFLMLFLLPLGLDMFIIQEAFNEVAVTPNRSTKSAQP